MSEHFLEEQLRRLREMTEQMTRLRSSAAEMSEAVVRERTIGRHDPLHEIRDVRIPSSEPPQRDRADEHGSRRPSRTNTRSRRK